MYMLTDLLYYCLVWYGMIGARPSYSGSRQTLTRTAIHMHQSAERMLKLRRGSSRIAYPCRSAPFTCAYLYLYLQGHACIWRESRSQNATARVGGDSQMTGQTPISRGMAFLRVFWHYFPNMIHDFINEIELSFA